MVGEASLLEVVVAALRREAAVRVVTLFGLRARGGATGADGASDVDLQVITRRPGRLADRAWLEAAVAPQRVRAWTVRAAFGGVKKVSARGDGGEVDLVVLPWAWSSGDAKSSPRRRATLARTQAGFSMGSSSGMRGRECNNVGKSVARYLFTWA
jgi:hypothetical protein